MATVAFASTLYRRLSLAKINAVVSARRGPTRTPGNEQPACFNRQVAMYLAKHVGGWSTTVIGRFYNGRDHSTVSHGIQRIESLRESNPGPRLCVLKTAALKYTEVVMAQVSNSSAPYADLLAKVFDLTGRGLSRPLAESILSLDFPENDAARAAQLNEKANEGTLTEAERDELQVYANVADLLAYWQLKARQALQRTS
jgi:Bacterial dnaA protein helix-turn-helix